MKKKDYIIMTLMAIILILIVSLIVVIGMKHIGYETKDVKKEKEVIKETVKNSSLTKEEQEKLISKIGIYDDYFISFDGTKEPNDMTNQEKIAFFVKLRQDEKEQRKIDLNQFSLSQVEEVLKDYFGQDMAFTPESYLCPFDNLPLFIYDPNTKTYHMDDSNHGHGGEALSYIRNFYVRGEKEQKKDSTVYKVEVKKTFSNFFEIGYPYLFYKTYQDAKEKKNAIFDLFTIYGEDIETDFDDKLEAQYERQKGLFQVYTYTFETKTNIDKIYLLNLQK